MAWCSPQAPGGDEEEEEEPRRGWWEAPLYSAEQRAMLVNVKLKWVKDRALDRAVSRERHLRAAHRLLDLVSSRPGHRVSRRELLAERSVHRLFGSAYAALALLGRYCTMFALSRDGGLSLTEAALDLRVGRTNSAVTRLGA